MKVTFFPSNTSFRLISLTSSCQHWGSTLQSSPYISRQPIQFSQSCDEELNCNMPTMRPAAVALTCKDLKMRGSSEAFCVFDPSLKDLNSWPISHGPASQRQEGAERDGICLVTPQRRLVQDHNPRCNESPTMPGEGSMGHWAPMTHHDTSLNFAS